jgi:hypothetical protein
MLTTSTTIAREIYEEYGNPFSFNCVGMNNEFGRLTIFGSWGNITLAENVKVVYDNEAVEFRTICFLNN